MLRSTRPSGLKGLFFAQYFGGDTMQRFTLALAFLAALAMATSVTMANRAGKSATYQLQFDETNGQAHVQAPELGGDVHIVVNIKGLDSDTEYVVKSQGQVVGQGVPNRGGNLNLEGTITDDQGEGKVNLRLASDNSLIVSTPVYVVEP
jgi:hypothetical protein